MVVLVLAGAAGAYLATSDGGPKRAVPWRDITAAFGPARWPRPTISIIRNRRKLVGIISVATLPLQPRPPAIDFTRREVIVVAVGPRSSTGYSLVVDRITKQDGHIDVIVRERTPTLGQRVTARVTFPFLVVTIGRSTKRVHVRFAGR